MKLATVLSGQAFIFRSLKEVLAKANELKSGDVLAGVAASSDLERIAAKEVLSQLLLSDLRNHPVARAYIWPKDQLGEQYARVAACLKQHIDAGKLKLKK